jgi:hypothetical protein
MPSDEAAIDPPFIISLPLNQADRIHQLVQIVLDVLPSTEGSSRERMQSGGAL